MRVVKLDILLRYHDFIDPDLLVTKHYVGFTGIFSNYPYIKFYQLTKLTNLIYDKS